MHSFLEIKSLILPVHIGLSEEERCQLQDIAFHITIAFPEGGLRGERTDKLENSVCYFKICERIKQITSQNSFSLIEKLAFDIFTELKTLLSLPVCLRVCVHKINPPIPHLKGGVSYTCSDFLEGWNRVNSENIK